MKAKSGQVEYGQRSFHQDASGAMKGDIIRGLIEAITNCDDAYGDKKGKIRVVYQGDVVRDYAVTHPPAEE